MRRFNATRALRLQAMRRVRARRAMINDVLKAVCLIAGIALCLVALVLVGELLH